MAIDMLSRWGSIPIIIGDQEEIQSMKGIADRNDGVYLVLAEREPIKLSDVTKDNVLSSAHFIVAALSPADEIDWAFGCRINDELDFTRGKDSTCGRPLTESELKSVTEDLVAGDFNLDFLVGTSEPETQKANNQALENAVSDESSEAEGSAPSQSELGRKCQ